MRKPATRSSSLSCKLNRPRRRNPPARRSAIPHQVRVLDLPSWTAEIEKQGLCPVPRKDHDLRHGHALRRNGLTLSPEYRSWEFMRRVASTETPRALSTTAGGASRLIPRWDSFEAFLRRYGTAPTGPHAGPHKH